jgi:glycosyl transferase family 87
LKPGRLVALTIAFACAHVILLIFSLIALHTKSMVPQRSLHVIAADYGRYHEIAEHSGIPYRDFEVEYPPVTLGAIKLLNGSTFGQTGKQIAVFSLFLSFGVAAMLLLGWGANECATYLGLTVPLALFVYFRLDLLAVFLALAAYALLQRNQQAWAGTALTFAVFAKVWPIVLVPLFVIQRRWKALGWFVGLSAAMFAVWVLVGGTDAPVQVATFRHAHGWQVESLVGNIVWIAGAKAGLQAGAIRAGSAPTWAASALLLAGVVVVAAAWRLRSRNPNGPRQDGTAMIAAVGAVLLISPILSPQYVVWLMPWAALAWRDRLLVGTTLAVSVLTTLMWFLPMGDAVFKAMVLVRNGTLVLLVGEALWRLRFATKDESNLDEPEGNFVPGATTSGDRS